MRLWFHPVRSGDFRLERIDGEKCRLTVENPTPGDFERLRPFLAKAREAGWIDPAAGVGLTGKTTLPIAASLAVAGGHIVASLHGDAATWTAIKFTDGNISLDTTGKPPEAPPPEADAAATVTPPKRGCPEPTSCERRASEVLRTFLTRRQWEMWENEGRIKVIGDATGTAYFVWHRDEAAARGLIRNVTIATNGHPVCAWDDTVPPEEEVLSLALAIRFRERWFRMMSDDLALPQDTHRPVQKPHGRRSGFYLD